jgi:hypothetical protein
MPVPTRSHRNGNAERSDPFAMAPAPIDAELAAQLTQRSARRQADKRAGKPPRAKATYDVPPALQRMVEEIAAAEQIGLSDVVRLAIVRLRADHAAGRLPDLTPMKRPSRSLKALYTLELPESENARR